MKRREFLATSLLPLAIPRATAPRTVTLRGNTVAATSQLAYELYTLFIEINMRPNYGPDVQSGIIEMIKSGMLITLDKGTNLQIIPSTDEWSRKVRPECVLVRINNSKGNLIMLKRQLERAIK